MCGCATCVFNICVSVGVFYCAFILLCCICHSSGAWCEGKEKPSCECLAVEVSVCLIGLCYADEYACVMCVHVLVCFLCV